MHALLLFVLADLAVLQKGASSLGFYTADGKPIAAVPVGKHPHEMVRVGDLIYTTDNGTMKIEQAGAGGNTVSIVDVKTRKKVGEIALGNFRRPHGIAYDPNSKRLAVSTELPDQLLLIDPATRKIVRTYDTGGKTAHMVVFSADGKFAYVSNSSSKTIAVIEIATGKIKLLATAERPEGSTRAPDGKTVYVTTREGRGIVAVDTATNTIRSVFPTGHGPVRLAVTPDSKTVVVAIMHDRRVEILDAATGKVTARIPIEGDPVSLTLSNDGKLAFASAEDINLVHIIDIGARKLSRTLKLADVHPDPVMELN